MLIFFRLERLCIEASRSWRWKGKFIQIFRGRWRGGGASSYLYVWNFERVLVVTLPSAANSESSEVGRGFLGGYSHEKGFAVISYSNPSF